MHFFRRPATPRRRSRRRRRPAPAPPPPAAAAARWTFEARQQLSLVVSGLPPPCLQDVVTIIFGQQTIQNGDEFTVDFAKLGVTICDRLQDYVEQQGTRVMQMQAGEPINDVPQIQRSPVSDEPPPKRQKAAESGTVGAAVRGRLPGRVVLDAKLDTARGAHSVVAAKGASTCFWTTRRSAYGGSTRTPPRATSASTGRASRPRARARARVFGGAGLAAPAGRVRALRAARRGRP